MKTKPGAYQRVADRYHLFAKDVIAHHANLHDVIIVGNAASNAIEGFGIWENAAQVATRGHEGLRLVSGGCRTGPGGARSLAAI